jgi:hypothetical protein
MTFVADAFDNDDDVVVVVDVVVDALADVGNDFAQEDRPDGPNEHRPKLVCFPAMLFGPSIIQILFTDDLETVPRKQLLSSRSVSSLYLIDPCLNVRGSPSHRLFLGNPRYFSTMFLPSFFLSFFRHFKSFLVS